MAFSLNSWEAEDGTVILRAPWVLIVLFCVYVLLIVSWLWELRRKRILKNMNITDMISNTSEILTTRFSAIDDADELLSPFIYNLDPAKYIANPTLDTYPEQPTKRERSFEYFCNPRRDPLPGPDKFKISFQKQYLTNSRVQIYASMTKGALKRCARFCAVNGTFAMTLTWFWETSEELAVYLNFSFFNEQSVAGNYKAAYEVQKVLMPLASFVLALFINMKLGWFNNIISLTWDLQGQLNDMALQLGSLLPQHDGLRPIKYNLYRYLVVVQFMLYKKIDKKYKSIKLSDLVECKLLTREEELKLMSAQAADRNMILLWLGSTFQQLARTGWIEQGQHQHLQTELFQARGKMDTLIKELTRLPPVSYMQIVQLMIDVAMLLSPPALAFAFTEKGTTRESITVYLWPAFGAMALSLFFQGFMRLITVMEQPFGDDLDDLHCDWLLMSSEKALFGYFTDFVPDPFPVPIPDPFPYCAAHPSLTKEGEIAQAEGLKGSNKGDVTSVSQTKVIDFSPVLPGYNTN